MRVYGLIPVRIESERLPRKALLEMHGLPMIIHVALRSKKCSELDGLWVCTDSSEIAYVCEKYKVNVCLTSSSHSNGTERIAEAAKLLDFNDEDIVVDIQGDEPLVKPRVIRSVINDTKTMLSVGGDVFLPHVPGCESGNKNIVKVIESMGRVLYLTRSDSPNSFSVESPLKKHLSVIGFSCKSLKKFASFEIGPLEKVEGVELLRALEFGLSIHTKPYQEDTFSVDVQADAEKAIRYMNNCPITNEIIGFDKYQ